MCCGFLKILNILDFRDHLKKKRFFFDILGVKNPKFQKTEIAVL